MTKVQIVITGFNLWQVGSCFGASFFFKLSEFSTATACHNLMRKKYRVPAKYTHILKTWFENSLAKFNLRKKKLKHLICEILSLENPHFFLANKSLQKLIS